MGDPSSEQFVLSLLPGIFIHAAAADPYDDEDWDMTEETTPAGEAPESLPPEDGSDKSEGSNWYLFGTAGAYLLSGTSYYLSLNTDDIEKIPGYVDSPQLTRLNFGKYGTGIGSSVLFQLSSQGLPRKTAHVVNLVTAAAGGTLAVVGLAEQDNPLVYVGARSFFDGGVSELRLQLDGGAVFDGIQAGAGAATFIVLSLVAPEPEQITLDQPEAYVPKDQEPTSVADHYGEPPSSPYFVPNLVSDIKWIAAGQAATGAISLSLGLLRGDPGGGETAGGFPQIGLSLSESYKGASFKTEF